MKLKRIIDFLQTELYSSSVALISFYALFLVEISSILFNIPSLQTMFNSSDVTTANLLLLGLLFAVMNIESIGGIIFFHKRLHKIKCAVR